MINRRELLLAGAAASTAPLFAARSNLKLGVTDWNLRMTGKVEAVALAASLGFQGVEVSCGTKVVDDKLPLDNPALIDSYLAAFKQSKIVAAGTCLDILHRNCLKNDKLAIKWIADAIPLTAKLNAKVLLLPFFGKCELLTPQDMDATADALKEVVKQAEKAGVTLGLENTISAKDNVRIMDRVGSPAVKVYYDVGNSTQWGHNILEEISWLGASRICQFHLKDKGFLGEGKIDFPQVMNRIMGLGFNGFANLETDAPSGSVEADMKRNLAYVQKLMA